ncbi:hypothetical protein VIGAN_01200500 [Vigna angularis var. angularis]|uniref:Uncharacterized protein n=1 Tax=Vigna angularis var. angularis TaxID=157739 RepID=A0A0S3R1B2_PHAAN|nr:hypothetical protein VIGAN_01200500 [Vigna angularis var. angularis]
MAVASHFPFRTQYEHGHVGGDTEPGYSYEEKPDPPLSAQDDLVESDVELDNANVVEPDNDPTQKMGDPSVEVTEQNMNAAQLAKSKAVDAISTQKCTRR